MTHKCAYQGCVIFKFNIAFWCEECKHLNLLSKNISALLHHCVRVACLQCTICWPHVQAQNSLPRTYNFGANFYAKARFLKKLGVKQNKHKSGLHQKWTKRRNGRWFKKSWQAVDICQRKWRSNISNISSLLQFQSKTKNSTRHHHEDDQRTERDIFWRRMYLLVWKNQWQM